MKKIKLEQNDLEIINLIEYSIISQNVEIFQNFVNDGSKNITEDVLKECRLVLHKLLINFLTTKIFTDPSVNTLESIYNRLGNPKFDSKKIPDEGTLTLEVDTNYNFFYDLDRKNFVLRYKVT